MAFGLVPLEKRLKENISFDETPHFVLSADDRCPFLNKTGLCDIYKELGEENLCNICKDHPRFRNFFNDRCELGLGLCCEAAAKLILSQKEPFSLVTEDGTEKVNKGERKAFFEERQRVFDIISDDKRAVSEKLGHLNDIAQSKSSQKSFDEWICDYLSLEVLDEKWKELLLSLKGKQPGDIKDIYNKETENLLNYFVFRHLKEEDFSLRLGFCLHCTDMIMNIFSLSEEKTFEKLCDIARMFSSEIEYSEENTDEIMFLLDIL